MRSQNCSCPRVDQDRVLAACELGAGRDARAVDEAADAFDLVGELLSDVLGVAVGVGNGAAVQVAEF